MNNNDQEQQAARFIGFFAAIISKAFLEHGGCEVDFKINGESLESIKQLASMDIKERIKLAVAEERFEDAAKLKRLLDSPGHKLGAK